MFREEAVWIKNALNKLGAIPGHLQVANIGSSTAHFRKVVQPHIHTNIIETLENAGWQVFNVDLKKEEGVDLVADVTKKDFYLPYTDKFTLTICTNLLEHVEDINLVVKNLTLITEHNGYLLITVPYKYRLHYDPIDNGFRPTPTEIAARLNTTGTRYTVVDERIITIEDLEYYRIRKSRIPVWGYRERIMFYLGKKHKVSGVLLQVHKN